MIKKSNDFGAGGVSVAIGEPAYGLDINLDAVPPKYEGLDGTELALSESQERMAVVVTPENADKTKVLAAKENLETTEIARVTADNRLKMSWRHSAIVDIKREFINTHGVRQTTDVLVPAPLKKDNFFNQLPKTIKNRPLDSSTLKNAWLENLRDLNIGSQKGLVERFDSTVGAGKGYFYAHEFPEKTTTMKTIPDEVKETGFYEPNLLGFEKRIKDRIEYWKRLKEKLLKNR